MSDWLSTAGDGSGGVAMSAMRLQWQWWCCDDWYAMAVVVL